MLNVSCTSLLLFVFFPFLSEILLIKNCKEEKDNGGDAKTLIRHFMKKTSLSCSVDEKERKTFKTL